MNLKILRRYLYRLERAERRSRDLELGLVTELNGDPMDAESGEPGGDPKGDLGGDTGGDTLA